MFWLVFGKRQNGFRDVFRLRQYLVFEVGTVGNKGVERGDSLHRTIQVFEQIAGNPGCDLSAFRCTEAAWLARITA